MGNIVEGLWSEMRAGRGRSLFGLRSLFGHQHAGRLLIQYEVRGCMAEDYRELDRGIVVGTDTEKGWLLSNPPQRHDVAVYVVERTDGTTFNAIADRCSIPDKRWTAWRFFTDAERTGKTVVELV